MSSVFERLPSVKRSTTGRHAPQEMAVAKVAILGDEQHLVGIDEGGNRGVRCLRAIQNAVHMGCIDAQLA
jgi:hypothetical protein